MRVLFITDIHFKHNNFAETDILMKELLQNDNLYRDLDLAVIGGDVLDAHERVDVQLMNRAYDMIRILRDRVRVIVCIGNHDMINNQQFMTSNHWMNGMKEWHNVTIVDEMPFVYEGFVFVPYVYPGRLVEALNTASIDWKKSRCIFAHQEMFGCKMGAFESKIGDKWELDWPLLISGHIHDRQMPQKNVLYPGSVIAHAFGDESQGMSIFQFSDDGLESEERISLGLKTKKTISLKVGDKIKLSDFKDGRCRLVLSGTADEIARHKAEKQSRVLADEGVKIVYRLREEDGSNRSRPIQSFEKVLSDLVSNTKDPLMEEDYMTVMTFVK